jgi:phospholipid/cholesterol/gamma-HCH transport system permease protein
MNRIENTFGNEVYEAVSEVGRSGMNLLETLKYIAMGKVNINDTAVQIVKAGIGSIFIVVITAAFIGLAMATQLAKEFQKFGADSFVGGLISVANVRELAPVIACIVVAGRVGASISAEIGSMKMSEQIDALSVLGINPIKYLLVPRLISASLVSPLLTIIAALVSIISGMFLAKISIGLNYSTYLNSIRQFLQVSDVFVMMLKSMVFGGAIAIIATTTGLEVKGSAEAVGNAATKTVVWSIILIFVFNYIITSIFFY